MTLIFIMIGLTKADRGEEEERGREGFLITTASYSSSRFNDEL